MKVICNGNDLSDALQKVVKAMPLKKTMPILEGINIKTEGNILIVSATDLDLFIQIKINAEVKIEGEIVVPGKLFAEYIKKINADEIELDATNKNVLKINYFESEGFIQCMNVDEFPPFKNASEDITFNMVKKDFRDLINKVAFAVATDDSRPLLKGCCLDICGGMVTAVASDGYRLALCNKTVDYNGKQAKIVIPSRAINEIVKLLEEDDDFVKINIDKNMIMLDMFHTKLSTRLLEGEYINYNRIIPNDFTTEINIEKKAFDDGLDRASLISRENNNVVCLEIKENNMTIASTSEIGNIKENVKLKLNGKDLKIGFNARYLTDSMKNITDNYIAIKGTSASAPIIIKQVENDKIDYLYLILPIRLS